MQEYGWLLWIVALALIFWLLIIRPASKRQKQVAQLQAALSRGDEVMLTSGVFGTVVDTADSHVLVEIAPGVTIKVARGGVGAVVHDVPEQVDDTPTEDAADTVTYDADDTVTDETGEKPGEER